MPLPYIISVQKKMCPNFFVHKCVKEVERDLASRRREEREREERACDAAGRRREERGREERACDAAGPSVADSDSDVAMGSEVDGAGEEAEGATADVDDEGVAEEATGSTDADEDATVADLCEPHGTGAGG